jgi:excisionase family DNA binding protein
VTHEDDGEGGCSICRYFVPNTDGVYSRIPFPCPTVRLGDGRMTLTEAAAILGTTPDNLRGAIARGSLKAVKHGRDWWVSKAEVERYQRENRRIVK